MRFTSAALLMAAIAQGQNCSYSGITTLESDRQNIIASADSRSGIQKASLDGLYFGKSDEQCNARAWLFRMIGRNGYLYMPPGGLRIENKDVAPNGEVRFRTEKGLADISYIFTGYKTDDGVRGTFSQVSGQGTENCSVTLQNLRPGPSRNNKESPLRYSTVEYVRESGDLIGAELIILPQRGGLTGIFTSFDGDMIPYATKIMRSENEIEFTIQTETERRRLKGTISPKSVKLRDIGGKADPNAATLTLIRKPFFDLFPDR